MLLPVLPRPVLATAVALALAVPLGGGTSSAAPPPTRVSQIVLDDMAEDVWLWSTGTSSWELWGDKPTADVLTADVEHGAKNIHVALEFDNLLRKTPARYLVRIKTKKMVRSAWVKAGPKPGWGGKHMLLKAGKKVPSPGFDHHIDYDDDVVTMVVPRALLDGPAWIKVLIRNDLTGKRLFTDNPHTTTQQPAMTGKIHTS